MVTAGDDYPIHQTPDPVAQVFTSDRNFYDRFFFNGYWREGEPYFAAALGVYPNLGIMDGAFSVIVDGVQHCVRTSRVLGSDRMDTTSGPLTIEIVKPMRVLRVTINHETIKGELTFHARANAIEEPRFTRRSGARITMDLTRFTQHGEWEGRLSVAGKIFEARRDRTWGSRDRSWGVRGVGERDPAGVPAEPFQYYWLWAPTNFEHTLTHFDVNENADGSRWHQFGTIANANLEAVPAIARAVDFKIDYRPGTRHARSAQITLTPAQGPPQVVELEPLYNFYMQGIGYLHPKWGHGMYLGPQASSYEAFKLAEVNEADILHQHIQAVCRAKLGNQSGMGILEMLILGPHQPSGFREVLDMHK